MPENKNKTKRIYHADSYTYDEYSLGMQKKNFTDPVMEKAYDERMKQGGVGPERGSDYNKRIIANLNKSRGTVSSAVRKEIK